MYCKDTDKFAYMQIFYKKNAIFLHMSKKNSNFAR